MLVYSTSLMQTKYVGKFIVRVIFSQLFNRQLDLRFSSFAKIFLNSGRVGRLAHQVSIVKYEKGKCGNNVTPIHGTVTFEVASFISMIFAGKAERKILLEPDLCLRRKMQFLSFARLPTGISFSPFQNLPRFCSNSFKILWAAWRDSVNVTFRWNKSPKPRLPDLKKFGHN